MSSPCGAGAGPCAAADGAPSPARCQRAGGAETQELTRSTRARVSVTAYALPRHTTTNLSARVPRSVAPRPAARCRRGGLRRRRRAAGAEPPASDPPTLARAARRRRRRDRHPRRPHARLARPLRRSTAATRRVRADAPEDPDLDFTRQTSFVATLDARGRIRGHGLVQLFSAARRTGRKRLEVARPLLRRRSLRRLPLRDPPHPAQRVAFRACPTTAPRSLPRRSSTASRWCSTSSRSGASPRGLGSVPAGAVQHVRPRDAARRARTTRSCRSTTTRSTRSRSSTLSGGPVRLRRARHGGPLLRAAVRRRVDEQLRLRRPPRDRDRAGAFLLVAARLGRAATTASA